MIIKVKNNTDTLKTWCGQEIASQSYYTLESVEIETWANDDTFLQAVSNSEAIVNDGTTDITSTSEAISYLRGDLPNDVRVNNNIISEPFASKMTTDGKKLFRRKHGIRKSCPANSVTNIEFVVPYTQCKINEAEIVNCSSNDNADFKVFDDEFGTYFGTPNLLLNQFGFEVCLSDGTYVDRSNYDADLFENMVVQVTFKNNDDIVKNIGVNVTIHEIRDI